MFISVDKWKETKLAGPRLIKIIENNKTVCTNIKEVLCLSDDQLTLLAEYLKTHFPKATIKGGKSGNEEEKI